MFRRYKITLEYVGTHFKGWQKQKNNNSIQETFEKAAGKFFCENINTVVAGRTDAGVHAEEQVIHLDTRKNVSKEKILLGINYHLLKQPYGEDISIKKVVAVGNNFNARFSAKKKLYQYLILNDKQRSPQYNNISWLVKRKLCIEKMTLASNYLIGKNDFSSFRSKGCQSASAIKTLDNIVIIKKKKVIKISYFAKSFLYNQVRIMTGTLKDVGVGKIEPQEIKNILKKKNRSKAGVTAPSKGLKLVKIYYK